MRLPAAQLGLPLQQHDLSIAVVRCLLAYSVEAEKHAHRIREQTVSGYTALDAMERHLAGRTSSSASGTRSPASGSTPTPTWRTKVAFDLGSYPAIRAWLDRVAAQPGHVTIDA